MQSGRVTHMTAVLSHMYMYFTVNVGNEIWHSNDSENENYSSGI
jgi:hypothetical protein